MHTVDDEAYSTTNWSNDIDATSFFSEDCASLSIEEAQVSLIDIYPNPTTGILKVSSQHNIETITIFNHLGEKVAYQFNNYELDLTHLPKGVYYIKVSNQTIVESKKIILQ